MLCHVVISATHATNDDLFTELSTETGERETDAGYGENNRITDGK